MDKQLMALIDKEVQASLARYYATHEVFVVGLERRPVLVIGLEKARALDAAFATLADGLRKQRETFVEVGYIKTHLPRAPDRAFFWYLIVSLTPEGVVRKAAIEADIRAQLGALFRGVGMHFGLASTATDPKILAHHNAQIQMSGRTDARPPRQKGDKPARDEKVLPESLPSMTGPMTVGKFFDRLTEGTDTIANPFDYVDFLKESTHFYKYWRTEWLAIKAYLRQTEWADDDTIELGFGTDPWDARIRRGNGSESYVEVTQALPDKAHDVRHAIARGFGLPTNLYLRTTHQKGIDEFPNPVVNAINCKLTKAYPDNTVLLVTVLGEYTGEDDAVIHTWVDDVRKRITCGAFSSIVLVEIARSRTYRIF